MADTFSLQDRLEDRLDEFTDNAKDIVEQTAKLEKTNAERKKVNLRPLPKPRSDRELLTDALNFCTHAASSKKHCRHATTYMLSDRCGVATRRSNSLGKNFPIS